MKKKIFLTAVAAAILTTVPGCTAWSDFKKGWERAKRESNESYHSTPSSSKWIRVDTFTRIKPNAYGPGVHMDQYGDSVSITPTRSYSGYRGYKK